ncbi:MAG TPA: HD domain-containing phosphohydrolase [Solirubrobacteraceae bacterium]|nr:HD domain-containing phosphohydrolase [Solirubrobacteraceae bacterium]
MITQPVADERSLLTFTQLDGDAEVAELLSAIQQLSLVRSLPEIQEIVRKAARRLTGADGATFVLREDGKCFYADEDAISPLWKGQRFAMDACISGWTMLNRKPALIKDIYADERVPHDAYRPTFVRSLAMVPIRQLDPLGAIGNYWAEQHEATAREVQLLQALADSTAVALENVRVYTELEKAHAETLHRLALAGEFRDDATYRHTARVAHVAALIAAKLGADEAFVSLIRRAAPLHDIGKLAVSDAILLKQDFLTSPEILHMRAHPECGAEILTGSASEVMKMAEEIALTHHEWWDGTGYPARLAQDQIPLSGRIVALADVFDALTHARPYKQPWSLDEAVQEIDHLSGKQFDPAVVSAFFELDEAELTPDPNEINDLAPGIHRPPEPETVVNST